MLVNNYNQLTFKLPHNIILHTTQAWQWIRWKSGRSICKLSASNCWLLSCVGVVLDVTDKELAVMLSERTADPAACPTSNNHKAHVIQIHQPQCFFRLLDSGLSIMQQSLLPILVYMTLACLTGWQDPPHGNTCLPQLFHHRPNLWSHSTLFFSSAAGCT